MAINPSLLVSAAVLQDYLVDNATGLPLAAGTISLYQDTSRTTYKNWYYLSGSPYNYTYITLPNPMTLSAVGTIVDGNGNDVIPFFYPYDENDESISQTYYIVVTNSNGQQQFTRQNFPFGAYSNVSPSVEQFDTLTNYVVNNVFWRNIGSLNATNVTQATLSPSSHDGFSMPDIQFFKQANGATDTLTFTQFLPGQFLNPVSVNPQNLDVTPEFYFNVSCSASGSETYKYIQIPISLHLITMESAPATVTLYARCSSASGTGASTITLSLFQFTGTGTSSPSAPIISTQVLPVTSSTSSFTKIVVSFTIPSAVGLTLGAGGDDALYLQIGYSVGTTFSIDIAKPCFYIGNTIAANECQTYDQVDAIINSPRTGDFRTSINSFVPFGWIAADDQSIGSATSGADNRANIDTWPLYNLIWNSVLNNWAPVSGGRGASAYADFSVNKALTLTRNLGRVISGSSPIFNTPITFTASAATNLLTFASNSMFTTGTPIQLSGLTGCTPLVINTVYYCTSVTLTTMALSTTIENAYANIVIDITVDGSGTLNNALGAYLGESTHTQLATEVAGHTHGLTAATISTSTVGGGASAAVGYQPSNSITQKSIVNGQTDANSPAGTPFNVIQPTTFYNVFIKL